MKTGLIYLVRNTVNCKVYVGQTVQLLEARWRSHKRHAINGKGDHLYSAMRLHGIDTFSIEVLETLPEDQLDLAEARWIAFYQSQVPSLGYNKTAGGGGIRGYRHGDDAKASMSRSRTGKPMPPRTAEHAAKIAAKITGRVRPQSERDQISATLKTIERHPNSIKALEANRRNNLGRKRPPRDPEWCKKLSSSWARKRAQKAALAIAA